MTIKSFSKGGFDSFFYSKRIWSQIVLMSGMDTTWLKCRDRVPLEWLEENDAGMFHYFFKPGSWIEPAEFQLFLFLRMFVSKFYLSDLLVLAIPNFKVADSLHNDPMLDFTTQLYLGMLKYWGLNQKRKPRSQVHLHNLGVI
jgi:hypothetical protein